VTRSTTTTEGVSTVTFTEIEKIDRIIDATTSTAIRLLTETSIHELRGTQPGTGQPSKWALQNTDADSVTVRLDVVPATGSSYSLQADGWTTLSDLSGSDEPVFPESFHDILAWFVISEELLKKEKAGLAKQYQDRAEQLLADLRFHLADSPMALTRQGSASTVGASGGGSGSGNTGGTSYTQSGLLTFDRGAGVAPFAVAQADAPYVANLGAEFLGNITTDRLIGRDTAGTGETEQLTVGGGLEFTGSGGIQRSALTGDVTASAGSGTTTIANDAVTYAKMQNVSATDKLLGRSTAGAGDVEEITCTAAGRALLDDAAASNQRTTLGLAPGTGLVTDGSTLNAIVGWGLSASVAGNALTVALVSNSGGTPSATDPVDLWFRNVTAATGTPTKVQVTAAATVVVPDTATLGTSNNVAFRAWIVAFNDAGTVRLGIINCANSTSLYPLGAWGIASSTTIGTGADSAQVFYTDTGVTSKAYVVLGYVTYESGLATAGTYASAPTRAQVYTADVPLPGRPIQTVMGTHSTEANSSSSAYADSGLTASITPTSAANRVKVDVHQNGCGKVNDTGLNLKLVRASTDLAVLSVQGGNTSTAARNYFGAVSASYLDAPATSSAVAYKTQYASAGNIATASVQLSSAVSTIVLTELMA